MLISPIKTHRILIGESIYDILDKYISAITENTILAITSKIISLCQGNDRIIPKSSQINKKQLIIQEADKVLQTNQPNPYDIYLTIKNNILIPSAGIDESNSNNHYILYPHDIQKTCEAIWNYIKQKYNIINLGIIMTDSHTTPLRRGVTGITLGWCGFKPLYSYIGKPDIYNHPLKVTQINLLDALAASAVLIMGEGNEQTPMALIQNAPKIEFVDHIPNDSEKASLLISLEEDLYGPLFSQAKWD